MCTVVTVDAPGVGPVRVMTTHLEFYSHAQRMAQACALRELHLAYSAQAVAPPQPSDDGSAFRTKAHTAHAVLCGDFNFEEQEAEYAAVTEGGAWRDAWRILNGDTPRAPTFRLFDRTYGPEPVACDFVMVSESLAPRVRSLSVDLLTRVSDHQPVAVELA
jgi:endonuclease/exonuclease/phosphatase family metal-dependent hydrolase